MQLTVVTCHSNIFLDKSDFSVWNFINFSFHFCLYWSYFHNRLMSANIYERKFVSQIDKWSWNTFPRCRSVKSGVKLWTAIKYYAREEAAKKMVNFLFLLSRHHSEAISLQNMKVLTSTWQQKKKKKLLQRELHENSIKTNTATRSWSEAESCFFAS